MGTLNLFQRIEAETIAFSKGIKSEPNAKTGVYVSEIHNGDYLKVREVDFGNKGVEQVEICAASALRGGTVEIYADSIGAP